MELREIIHRRLHLHHARLRIIERNETVAENVDGGIFLKPADPKIRMLFDRLGEEDDRLCEMVRITNNHGLSPELLPEFLKILYQISQISLRITRIRMGVRLTRCNESRL
jgi:hypothetical protein